MADFESCRDSGDIRSGAASHSTHDSSVTDSARVICVTIKQSYNRGKVPAGCLQTVCLRRLIRPMARSCYILTDYDAVNAYHSREVRERSGS